MCVNNVLFKPKTFHKCNKAGVVRDNIEMKNIIQFVLVKMLKLVMNVKSVSGLGGNF